jgi:two-component system, NarL family, response regulator NreC
MPRVLLVDDHAIVRAGVARLLGDSGEFDVVGECADAREAVRQTRRLSPDVVVLDVNLGVTSGLDVIAELREIGPRVVMLSMEDDIAAARRAFERGAQGYVLKDAAADDLADAIRAVLADKMYIHQALAARLVLSEPEDDLSDRERDVLRLIALGYTNQEIAKQLYLSVRTVEAHRRHILNKLRLETRADLVRYALEHRLVQLG